MKQIKLQTNFEGFHCWPNAPEEVDFLKNLHRHLFGVVVKIQVMENDRELEYFMVLRDIKAIIENYLLHDIRDSSCETMAEILLDCLEAKYRGRKISVEINEDSENGSIVDNYENF